MATYSTTIGLQANQSSPGQPIDFEDAVVYGCSIQNNSGVSIQYSSDGVSWATLDTGNVASPPVPNPTAFRLRKTTGDSYPVQVGLSWSSQGVNDSAVVARRNIIIDTDWWTDCDDVLAIRMAVELERLGLWNILGIAISATLLNSAKSLDLLMLFSGRANVPIFIPKTSHTPPGGYTGANFQTNMLATSIPGGATSRLSNTVFNVPDAVAGMTHILQNTPGPVEIVAIGYPTNLHELLLAQPALVASKVSKLWMMAGAWPSGSENNFNRTTQSQTAGAYVCANWPTPITFLGFEIGNILRTGGSVYALGAADPVAKALIDYGTANAQNTPYGRPSWDPLLMLLAACGSVQSGGYLSVQGTAVVDGGTGANTFTQGPGRHEYVTRNPLVGDEYFVDAINDLIYPNTARTYFTRADGTVFPSTASISFAPSAGVTVDIADLKNHYNAQDTSDIADAAVVTTVFDRVRASTFTLTGTGGGRPVMATKGALRCWQFSGAQVLTVPAYVCPARVTVYAKVWFDVAPGANQCVVANEDITPTTPARSFQLKVASGIACQGVSFNGQGGGGTVDAANAVAITTGAWHVIAFRRTNLTLEAFYDGVSNGSTALAAGTFGNNGDSVAAALNLGARRSDFSSEPMTGFIRSVRIYRGAHTDAQVAAVGAEM